MTRAASVRGAARGAATAFVAVSAILLACGAPQAGAAAPRVAAAPPQAPAASPEQRLAAAREHLEASRYAEAEREFRQFLEESSSPQATLGLARVLYRTGRAGQVPALLQPLRALPDHRGEAAVLAARALRRVGQREQARAVLRELQDDPLPAPVRLMLGELAIERGDRQAGEALLMTLIEDYNEDRLQGTAVELGLVGRAAHLLRSPHDANDAFDAAEAAGFEPQVLLWRAELFLEKHDPGHAEEVLSAVLDKAASHPEALVGMAQVRLDQAMDFQAARQLALEALRVDPSLWQAHFVLAGLALRHSDFAGARTHVEAGLAISAEQPELLSLLGAIAFLKENDRLLEEARGRAFRQNPRYSSFYTIIGKYAEWEHRYDDIVAFMQEALQVDPRDAAAYAALGMNLLRAGEEEEGLEALARAFAEDPFDVRVFNTLNLYEKVIPLQYESAVSGRFRIRYPRAERPLLERYVPAILEQAWEKLREYYEFVPTEPIFIELYAEREHFAVRTSGRPQTAIQGVCFGRTLATMSPRAESFNLPMTLWHELSHVFHIQLSGSRVPRWLTEGLAEYETLAEHSEWSRHHDPELYRSRRRGRVPPVADMNLAFSSARSLQDMAMAYYTASQVASGLVQQWGRPKINSLLASYEGGRTTAEALVTALGESGAAQVDARFSDFLDRRLSRYASQFVPIEDSTPLAELGAAADQSPKDAQLLVRLAHAALREQNPPTAERAIAAALALEPNMPDALFLQARLLSGRGEALLAKQLLSSLAAAGSDGFFVQMALAEVSQELSDSVARRAALESAHRFDPTQSAPLMGLAELARSEEDDEREIEALQRLSKLEQHQAPVHHRLLALLVESERFDEALEYGEPAIFADLGAAQGHLHFAQALAARGQPARAQFEFESALLCPAPDEQKSLIHDRFAAFLAHEGKAEEAKAHRRQARDLSGGHP